MEEVFLGLSIMEINHIKNKADQISSYWNGETEKGEEKARLMNEISDKCVELINLLKEVNPRL